MKFLEASAPGVNMKMPRSNNLSTKLKSLPPKPGIYLFKDAKGEIIYIGKALSLKHRILSYFKEKRQDLKIQKLVSQVVDLDYLVVLSEFEALLLEAKLIKEYQPKYNSQLKDDKRYLYIAITNAPFRIFPTRRPDLEKNLLDWYGPFPSARDVRQVLRLLRKVFPYCSCKKPPKRQCLYFHIDLCPGFEKLSSFDYKRDIANIRRVLSGKTKLLSKQLEKRMTQAAKKLHFERAQKYKKQLEALFYVTQGWRTIPHEESEIVKSLLLLRKFLSKYQGIEPITLKKIEAYDVSNLGKDIIVGSLVTFVDGQPEKGLYRRFKINFVPRHPEVRRMSDRRIPSRKLHYSFTNPNDPGSINQIIARRLNHPEWLYPQLILVDGGKAQVSAAFKAIKEKGLSSQICLLGLAKKQQTIIVPRIRKNQIIKWSQLKYSRRSPILKLLQQIRDESHRFAQKYYQKLHSQRTFRIS